MSEQICPKCKELSFTWNCDDDTPLTHWICGACGYAALEDEKLESICPCCGARTQSHMFDASGQYKWCSSCGDVIILND